MPTPERPRPDLLFVAPVLPAATGGGLAMRAGLFLEGLARAFRVCLLVVPVLGPLRSDDGFAATHAAEVAVLPFVDTDPLDEARHLLSTDAGRAQMEATHPLPRLCPSAAHASTIVVEAFGSRKFAAVHAMRLYLAPFALQVLDAEKGTRPFSSLDLDDDDAAVQAHLGNTEESVRYERLAAYALPRFDLVAAASPGALARVCARHRSCEVETIPNAVVRLSSVTSSKSRRAGPVLLFVGDLGYRPNAEAALRLCDEILPALRAVAPEASAVIVGDRPPARVRELADRPGVTVTGRVESVSAYYDACDVAVVPLAVVGGGSTKIVEAFAHRVPVVSTAAAADSLGPNDGLLLRAELPSEFVAAVLRLCDDAALRTALLDAAERAYRERFSLDVVAAQIARTWTSRSGHPSTVSADARG